MGNVRLIMLAGSEAEAQSAYWQNLCLGEFVMAQVSQGSESGYLRAAAALLHSGEM